MSFVEFLLNDLFSLTLIVVSITVALVFFYKTLKNESIANTAFTDNNQTNIEAETKEETESGIKITENQNKQLSNAFMDMDEDENANTDKLIAERIDKEYLERGFAQNEMLIPDEMIKEISGMIDLRQGGVINYIKRIDEEGKILFPLDALDFISKKHKPLIMPDGSIRVLNFLSIDEEIFLSIKEKKPLFYIEEKEKTIKRLDPEQVEQILLREEKLKAVEHLMDLEKKIDEMREANILLNKEIENLQDKYVEAIDRERILISTLDGIPRLENLIKKEDLDSVKLKHEEAQSEIYDEDDSDSAEEVETKEVLPSETVEENAKGSDSEIKVGIPRRKRKKKDEQEEVEEQQSKAKATPIVKEEPVVVEEQIVQEAVIVPAKEVHNNKTVETKTEHAQPAKEETQKATQKVEIEKTEIIATHAEQTSDESESAKGEMKRLSKKDLKRIQDTLFSEQYLLSEAVLNNAQGKPNQQLFISSIQNKDKTKLYIVKKNLDSLVKKVLDDLFGLYNKDPREVVEWLECNTIIDKYFAQEGNGNKIYHAVILEVEVATEMLYGLKLSKRFTLPFTKQEDEDEIKISDGKRKIFYEDLLDIMKRGVYEKI
jgi:hypothetical protein